MIIKQLRIGICLIILTYAGSIFPSPPYLTDDPAPAYYRQLQVYPFAFVNSPTHATYIQAPALEMDYGLIPNTEIHFIFSINAYIPDQAGRAVGMGDIEFGVKQLLLSESTYLPMIALAPALEWPAGSAERNLGNGRLWTKLPIWFEKNWGRWKMCAGGGYGFNSAPGMKTFLYGGWLLQRTIGDKILIGGELFSQGSTAAQHAYPFQDTGYTNIINVGGGYNFNSASSFLFSLGHSISGVTQWVGYAGFYISIDT